jgi:hypothetical protein
MLVRVWVSRDLAPPGASTLNLAQRCRQFARIGELDRARSAAAPKGRGRRTGPSQFAYRVLPRWRDERRESPDQFHSAEDENGGSIRPRVLHLV